MYYIARSQTALPSPSPAPSQHTDLNLDALRSLNFFHDSTAAQLEQPFGSGLWSQAISCLLHSQPAIKHGLIALAAFHENYQHTSISPYAEKRKVLALEYYGRSISGIVQLRLGDAKRSLGPTLVASLLFCLIESLQGHFHSALKHVAAGVDLLTQCESDPTVADCLPSDMVQGLGQIFISLSMQAVALEDNVIRSVLSRYLDQSHLRATPCFSTIEQALADVAHLQIDGMKIAAWSDSSQKHPDFPSPALQQAVQALYQRYDSWNSMYHDLANANVCLEGTKEQRTRLALLTLCINQHVTKIILSVIFKSGQSCFDAMVSDFNVIVSSAEEMTRIESEHAAVAGKHDGPVFNSAMGIVPAIFYTSVRCRDYFIRHRALSYLKNTRRREALWDTNVVASIAERVIAVEEEAAAQYLDFTDNSSHGRHVPRMQDAPHSLKKVPESERIERLVVDFLDSETSAKISLVSISGSNKHQGMLVWDG